MQATDDVFCISFVNLKAQQERLSNYFKDNDRWAAVWNNVGLEDFTAT